MNKNISFLQLFGILLVVLGHSFTSEQCFLLHYWIYSFHMPLFIFISGYLLELGFEKNDVNISEIVLSRFYLKKAKRLLVPYVCISSIVLIPKAFLSVYAIRPVHFSSGVFINNLIYPGENVIIFYWFLPTIFLLLCLVATLCKFISRIDITIFNFWFLVLAFLLSISCVEMVYIRLFNISGVFYYLLFFLLGMYICRYRIIEYLNKGYVGIFLLYIGITYVFYRFVENVYLQKIFLPLCGITVSLYLSNLLSRINIDFFKGSSYTIYLYSWFPQVFIQILSMIILKYGCYIPWYVYSLMSFLCGFFIPLFMYKLLNIKRNKFVRRTKYIWGIN